MRRTITAGTLCLVFALAFAQQAWAEELGLFAQFEAACRQLSNYGALGRTTNNPEVRKQQAVLAESLHQFTVEVAKRLYRYPCNIPNQYAGPVASRFGTLIINWDMTNVITVWVTWGGRGPAQAQNERKVSWGRCIARRLQVLYS